MSDRRKEDIGCVPLEEIMPVENVPHIGFNRRSGTDRRKVDLLARALERIECPPHHQSKTWETAEKSALHLIIQVMERRK
jgi:hypothetical protein